MRRLNRIWIQAAILGATLVSGLAQKFLPDDPLWRDPDDLSIARPAARLLSPTYDVLENTIGSEADPAQVRAQNINTLGEVPDSSWFTNRLGTGGFSMEEHLERTDGDSGPDMSEDLRVVGSARASLPAGIVVRDCTGDVYYLVFDRRGFPNLATGAAVISSHFLHAAGYNVPSGTLVSIDPSRLVVDPQAGLRMLDLIEADLDEEYLRLFFREMEPGANGQFRAFAIKIPEGITLGEFKFYGIRSDDPNDLFLHENRRELRGLRVFSAWLNHYLCRSINTRDFFVTEGDRSFIRHYVVDFTATLGAGRDLTGRIIPKDEQSGNEYVLWGSTGALLKTAVSLGFWKRPWMRVEYPLTRFPEIGRIEAEFYDPGKWRTAYPNAAFDRMLPDDAFWAANILRHFSDEAIRAVVGRARYSDPEAAEYLAQTLIQRRDKTANHYLAQINPLRGFRVEEGVVHFQNLGVRRGMASEASYQYQWFQFDNLKEEFTAVTEPRLTGLVRVSIPGDDSEYLMLRLQTRSSQQQGWRKNIDVYLRMNEEPTVVGIEREVGSLVLERTSEGRLGDAFKHPAWKNLPGTRGRATPAG